MADDRDIFYVRVLSFQGELRREWHEKVQEDKRWRVEIMYNFDDLYQYTAYWLSLYLGIIMQLFDTVVDFYLFYNVPVANMSSKPSMKSILHSSDR